MDPTAPNLTATTLFHPSLNSTAPKDEAFFYPFSLIVPITIVYAIIFITGVVGNVMTCIVISRNKSMQTATNYYLFSLAISDMLLLISGLPTEMYGLWWPKNYIFGEAICVLQGIAAETSANATILTITAFTVERYMAICHPFLSHTMSKLSRAIRYIIAIWIVALCLAAPQAVQFGVLYEIKGDVEYSQCTVVNNIFQHAFEISTFVFFVGPMTLITVLYVLIGVQLRKSSVVPKRASVNSGSDGYSVCRTNQRNTAAQNRVVKMLIAVVAAFFICWAPFHAQRLLAVYLTNANAKGAEAQEMTIRIYMILMYTSGILYFLSTTINPLLYNIMSNKFREAFQKTIKCQSNSHRSTNSRRNRPYSILSRYQPSTLRRNQTLFDSENKLKHHLKKEDNYLATTILTDMALSATQLAPPSDTSIPPKTTNKSVISSTTPQTLTILHSNNASKTSPPKDDAFVINRILRLFRTQQQNRFNASSIYRQNSVDSQTISNSSLQDVEDIDYSSSDLVKYMEEVNNDIVA